MATDLMVSFATEDLATPEHDQVIVRLADFLHSRGITGSFHLTGDYARYLWRQNKTRVIKALERHEIGYHSNTHGCFPFLGEIAENYGWDEAVARYMYTESQGINDIYRLFRRSPAYIVTEFLKIPQLIDAYNRLGIKVMGLTSLPGDTPFVSYAGTVCYRGPLLGVESAPHPGRLEKYKNAFKNLQEAGEPVIKIFLHPYKLIYNNTIEAWHDINNFYRSYDIQRPWVSPQKSLYDQSTFNELIRQFEDFIDFTLEQDTRYCHTEKLAYEYYRPNPLWVSRKQADELWRSFTRSRSHVDSYSPAEIVGMRAFSLAEPHSDKIMVRNLLGPESVPVRDPATTVHSMNLEMDYTDRLPVKWPLELFCGEFPVIAGCGSFLEKSWTRSIYPDGFTAANICKSARLQSWSYRPAAANESRSTRRGTNNLLVELSAGS